MSTSRSKPAASSRPPSYESTQRQHPEAEAYCTAIPAALTADRASDKEVMAGILYTEIASPVGRLLLAMDEAGLRHIQFVEGRERARPAPSWAEDRAPFSALIRELRAYFRGELERFAQPLAPEGTPFQRKVWQELCGIPYGETISYGELANRIGNPHASRAVGLANGSNPLPIVIPCHRVIGSNGKLTGYGGGLPIKEKLLALERGQLRLL